MEDTQPNLIFKIIDPLFLKLGKPIARHVAKKDKTENILFKRANQSKLVVFTAIKWMKRSYSFFRVVSSFAFAIWITAFFIVFILIPLHSFHGNFMNDLGEILYPSSLLAVVSSLTSITRSKQAGRLAITVFCYQNEQIHALKNENYRWIAFFVKTEKVIFSSYVMGFFGAFFTLMIMIENHIDVQSMFAVIAYLITLVLISFNWLFNYIMAASIYHCDDTGTKERKEAKEEKISIVTDAV